MTVTVVDIGMGNVGSVANMLRKVGAEVLVTADPAAVADATSLILPGVGAFDSAMERLRSRGLGEALHICGVERRVPVLGICLGMQLLGDRSEEGSEEGLGWIPGSVRRLPSTTPDGEPVKVPHMGWARIEPAGDHTVFRGAAEDSRYYFVHSFAFVPEDERHVAATAHFAGTPFCAAVSAGNLLGVQFHPEKSHRHGMAILRSFATSVAG